ncbi:T9SS type A sorting domain-containing protein [Bacteroides salyersiae]|nr:T9SS type A sorting domain-containing protein [Bacteroides salyersiae]
MSINNNKIDINSESEIGDITIWNIHGTKVINKTIRETTTELDINSLQNGIYLFKSKKDCIKFTKK